MDDKEFISYFEQLSQKLPQEIDPVAYYKNISDKIINTLLAISHQPHSNGEFKSVFGAQTSQDLDYTLKRLVNGCASVGSFKIQVNYSLVLREVLKKFARAIEVEAYFSYIKDCCNEKNAIKKSENVHFIIGRIFAISGLLFSEKLEQLENTQQALALYKVLYQQLIDDFIKYQQNQQVCQAIVLVIEQSLAVKKNTKDKFKLLFNMTKNFQNKDSYDYNTLTMLLMLNKMHENDQLKSIFEKQILNFNHLKNYLVQTLNIFPKQHKFYVYLTDYLIKLSSDTQLSQNNNQQFWHSLWDFLLIQQINEEQEKQQQQQQQQQYSGKNKKTKKQMQQQQKQLSAQQTVEQHKYYFITLSIFKQLVKHQNFNVTSDLKCIQHDGLMNIWQRNLDVKNQYLKGLALKIQSRLSKKVQQLTVLDQQQNEHFLEFLKFRSRSFKRLTPKNELLKSIFSILDVKQAFNYFKYLKKQISSCLQLREFLFNMSELNTFSDICAEKLDTTQLSEIGLSLLNYAQKEYIENELKKFKEERMKEEDYDEEEDNLDDPEYVNQLQETIYGYFYSLINGLQKQQCPLQKYQKNIIWRGLDENHVPKLQTFLNHMAEKFYSHESANKINYKHLQKHLKICQNLQQRIVENLEQQSEQQRTQEKANLRLNMLMAYQQLYLGVCVQSFENFEEMLDIMNDLNLAIEDLDKIIGEQFEKAPIKKIKQNNGMSKVARQQEKQENKFIQVLSEINIQLLTKSHNYLRELVKKCFLQFLNNIDEKSIENLVGVITRKNQDYIEDMEQEDVEQE